jgi:GNAT superfamily N-acetyltransferase
MIQPRRSICTTASSGVSPVFLILAAGVSAGYVRALSDRVAVTDLAAGAVVASHRRHGIGMALVARCLKAFENMAVFASASPGLCRCWSARACGHRRRGP